MTTRLQHISAESRAQGRGLIVIAVLAVLTIVEYLVAISLESPAALVALLALAAVAKAWLIMVEFMHLPKLWRADGGH